MKAGTPASAAQGRRGEGAKSAWRIGLLAPLAVPVVAVAAWLSLPWPLTYRWIEPGRTSLMRYRLARGGTDGEELELRRTWVPLDGIAPSMIRAVILAEDARFREHRGIDWHALSDEVRYDGHVPLRWNDAGDRRALAEAVRYGWTHRHELRGRSTITQQLAKNLYYTPERSLGRKLGEFFVARRLERFLGKDRILELYLNSVELGPGLFGVEEAAREYFGVPASELSPYQAASLAATLPHPLTSNPSHRPARMAWRRDLILARMRGGGEGDRTPIPEAPPEIDPPDLEEPADTGSGGGPAAEPPDTAALPDTTVPPDTTTPPDTSTARDTTTLPDTTTAPDTTAVPHGATPRNP